MNSALNLINPQRFHVLIPKVKGVIVLTNEVSVPPSGNKRKKEENTASAGSERRQRAPTPLCAALLLNRAEIRRHEAPLAGTGGAVEGMVNMARQKKSRERHGGSGDSSGRQKIRRLPIFSAQTFEPGG